MLAGSDRLKKETGYNPTRFNQMVDEHGGVGAAKILIGRKDASDGFTVLWEKPQAGAELRGVCVAPLVHGLIHGERAGTSKPQVDRVPL